MRKSIIGLGGSVVFASIGLFASGWPSFIAAHAWIVWAGAIVGVGLMVGGFIVPAKKQVETPAQSVGSGNLVGRDNSGKMIFAQHYHEAPPPLPPDLPKPPPLEHPSNDISPKGPSAPLRLELSFERTFLTYKIGHSAWDVAGQFDHDGKESLIAWFANPVPPMGVHGIDATQLSAHIKYSIAGQWEAQVPRGYWLQWSSNEVIINTADRAGLILGFVYFSHWIAYANPYSSPATEGILQPAFRHPGQESKMPIVDMDVEISLLIKGRFTLDKQKLRLCFSQGHPYAVRIP